MLPNDVSSLIVSSLLLLAADVLRTLSCGVS